MPKIVFEAQIKGVDEKIVKVRRDQSYEACYGGRLVGAQMTRADYLAWKRMEQDGEPVRITIESIEIEEMAADMAMTPALRESLDAAFSTAD